MRGSNPFIARAELLQLLSLAGDAKKGAPPSTELLERLGRLSTAELADLLRRIYVAGGPAALALLASARGAGEGGVGDGK